MDMLEIVAIAFLSTALLFNIISLSTPGWMYFPPSAYPDEFPDGISQGLFSGLYGDQSTTGI